MALGKILNLGGIENSSPRADQSPEGFRVARNVMPTPDGSLIPRYHWEEPESQPTEIKNICNISQYDNDVLVLGETQSLYGADAVFELYKNNSKIPKYSDSGIAPTVPFGGSDLQQSYRFNNTVYYLNPYGGTLLKYDGVELGYAGCNQPNFTVNGYSASGSRYLKVIQHTFDFDSNEPVSEYVQFPTTLSLVTVLANLHNPPGYSRLPGDFTNVEPKTEIPPQLKGGNYFIGTASYNSASQDYVISLNTARQGTTASPSTTITVPQVGPTKAGTVAVGGSTTITMASSTDLQVGMKVFGVTIPADTEIVSIPTTGSIVVNNTITAGAKTLTFSDLIVGSTVYGSDIPANTSITSVVSATSITVNNTIPTGTRTLYFEYQNTNITTDRIGSYVFVAATKQECIALGFASGERAIAMKVKSVSPLVLDALNIRVFSDSRKWGTLQGSVANLGPNLFYGTRTYFSYWESASPTGVFYYRTLLPSFPDNNSSLFTAVKASESYYAPFIHKVATTGVATATIGSDSNMFLMSPILNDWYNTTTKKVSPNSADVGFSFGIGQFHSMTKYQDLLLLANDQLIWFSDTSLGGWIDQFESSNSILIGDMQYGKITSICGTGDFLFVGRERKNYYVNGNIATGNYRVQEIAEVQVGPWNNVSSIQVKDSVVFINSSGIFSVAQGGTVQELSKKCRKNFDSFNPININEDVSFRLTGASATYSSYSISSAYDEYRGFIIFMKREEGNPCLVLNVKNGDIYEWNGLYSPSSNVYANCINFIYGKYYVGGQDFSAPPSSYTSLAKYAVESFTSSRDYITEYPLKLYTTWLTAGEPSLEKEILQLKLFGRISANNKGLIVKHYKDWNKDIAITDSQYFPIDKTSSLDNQTQFSHKKRLTSDKCLSASVGIEITDPSVSFELESFEVEFNSIQTGMKR